MYFELYQPVGAELFPCTEVFLLAGLLGKEPAEAKVDMDICNHLYATVELHYVLFAVVLTGGTAGPHGLPEYLGDLLTGGTVSERQGIGHDDGTSKPAGQGRGWPSVPQHEDQGKGDDPENAAKPVFGQSSHSSACRLSTTMRCGGCH